MMTEAEHKFSIPPTDKPELEHWLSHVIRANQIVSYDTSEPDYFIRNFEEIGSGDATQGSALLSMERAEKIERIRHNHPTTFTFTETQEPAEALVDADIDRNE